jgi:2,3-bisphosphoglycerate-dependent phosphoglycerate mutase
MTKILLVRHGETNWNKEHRLQGHIDIALNDQGIVQAKLLSQALAKEKIDVAYSSDLSRAFDTANAITAHHAIPTIVDVQLRERCYGEIQGMTYQEIEEKLPENHRAWHSRDPDFQPKGGETLRQFYQRVTTAMQRIAKNHFGEVVLVVAHGGVLDCMYRFATEMDISEKRKVELLNTSLNRLMYVDERFQVEEWGDVSHLKQSTSLDDVDSGSPSVPWLLP